MSEYVPVTVRGVYFVSTITGPQAVVFLSDNGDRMVPIYIGPAEAISIDTALRKETTPRPMTHDLIKTIMDSCGISIHKIVIDDLDEQVFYARLLLREGERDIEIDARPSDCIALAVRSSADIVIEQSILDKVSIDRKDIEAAGQIEDFFE